LLVAVIARSVVLVVVLTAVYKVHPFLSLLLGAFFVGIASGMPLFTVADNVNDGFGGLMKSIGIVIVAGTIIGVILENSGENYLGTII
jgi:GntP family gluconate:H+ symporter